MSSFFPPFFFLQKLKEFLRQNRKPQREQLANLISCSSSDSFLLHKQCWSGLERLKEGAERPENQAEPSSLSASDSSTLRHVHLAAGRYSQITSEQSCHLMLHILCCCFFFFVLLSFHFHTSFKLFFLKHRLLFFFFLNKVIVLFLLFVFETGFFIFF